MTFYNEELNPWELADKLEKDNEYAEEYAEYLYEQQRDKQMEEHFDKLEKT